VFKEFFLKKWKSGTQNVRKNKQTPIEI